MQGGGELVKMWHLKEMGTNSALMVIIHVIQVQSIHNNCVLPLGETCTILMCECLGSGGGHLKWPLRMPPLGRHTCKVPHIVWGFWDTFLHYWALHQSSFYTLVSYGPYTDKKRNMKHTRNYKEWLCREISPREDGAGPKKVEWVCDYW